jgi:hypothetical protein
MKQPDEARRNTSATGIERATVDPEQGRPTSANTHGQRIRTGDPEVRREETPPQYTEEAPAPTGQQRLRHIGGHRGNLMPWPIEEDTPEEEREEEYVPPWLREGRAPRGTGSRTTGGTPSGKGEGFKVICPDTGSSVPAAPGPGGTLLPTTDPYFELPQDSPPPPPPLPLPLTAQRKEKEGEDGGSRRAQASSQEEGEQRRWLQQKEAPETTGSSTNVREAAGERKQKRERMSKDKE